MAEGEHGLGTPFDSLPDEVVVQIFSYFSFNELLDVLQNVCVRWKRLAHTPVLWLDKEYVIRGRRWRLQGRSCCGVCFSECVHVRCHKTDEQVLQAVGTMPHLRRLTVMRAIRGRILCKVCENCPNLTNLQIECSQVVNYAVMKHVFEKCPKIQKLTLPAGMVSKGGPAALLSLLEHLTCLVLVDDFRNSTYINLRGVADACRGLREIHTDSSEYDMRDVEYFLKKKKDGLTSASLHWMMGVMEKWCVVPMLKRCETSLKKLRLLRYYLKPDMEAAAFKALSELRSLHELHADRMSPCQPQLLTLPFRPGCLTELRRLRLRFASNLQDETLLTICQNCPHLCELRLMKSQDITDAALSEIHRLKHLEILELSGCSGLGGTAMVRIAPLPALHTLVLQLLDLTRLQPSLLHIVNMKELRYLDIFNSRNITTVPFELFPGRLKKLRLELSGCDQLGGAALTHIAELPALHTLVLKSFDDLTRLQPSLLDILKMKELLSLKILKCCNIRSVPFYQFPSRLVKLRELATCDTI